MRENGVGPNGTESPGGESERIKGQPSTTLQKPTEKSRRIWSNETQEEPIGPGRKSPLWLTLEQRRT